MIFCVFVVSILFSLSFQQNIELLNLFAEKEGAVLQIAKEVHRLYESSLRCNLTKNCKCTSDACQSQMTNSQCNGELRHKDCTVCNGYMMDYEKSVVRLNSNIANGVNKNPTDQLAKESVCFSSHLDDVFKNVHFNVESMDWQGFGTHQGIFRIYPGRSQKSCGTYDSRLRNWYASASAGPKDVVIMIDKSGTMDGNERWSLAKEAVETVLKTLTLIDYVNIVVFSNDAHVLHGSTLIRATTENKDLLLSLLDEVVLGGVDDFKVAFEKSFELLNNSYILQLTSSCETSILFLTDGHSSSSGVESYVLMQNNALKTTFGRKAKIFSYSLSTSADQTTPKNLACQSDGIWQYIPDHSSDLRSVMGMFYDYYAAGMGLESTNRTVWCEPYNFFTAGQLGTTVSTPIYDSTTNPPFLIGVVGVGLTLEKINAVESNYQNVLNSLIARSNFCPSFNLSFCQLEALRERTQSTVDSRCDTSGTICSGKIDNSLPQKCNSLSDDEIPKHLWCNTRDLTTPFTSRTCCWCFAMVQDVVVALIILFSFFFIVLIISIIVVSVVLFYVIYRRSKTGRIANLLKGIKVDELKVFVEQQKNSNRGERATIKIDKSFMVIPNGEVVLQREIGKGGSGTTIYEAKWNNKTVAYKVFKLLSSQNETFFDEFEKETALLSSLNHPNIIQFYGATTKPPRVGIVMEYCPKKDLNSFMMESKGKIHIPLIEKIRILSEIADGMAYLHSRNVIHRDLKSQNCLLTEYLTLKLIDFGLSKVVGIIQNQQLTKRVGTGFYMSPEVLKHGKYNSKADVFSYSMIVYEVLFEVSHPYVNTISKKEELIGIEFKVAEDKHFRPKIDRTLLKEGMEWMLKLMETCWNANPSLRPSFEDIRKNIEKNTGNSHKTKEYEEKRKSKFEILFI